MTLTLSIFQSRPVTQVHFRFIPCLFLLLVGPARGQVVRLEILSREAPAFDGATFGVVGTFGFQPNIPWLTYRTGPGGTPLGDPPRSEPAP